MTPYHPNPRTITEVELPRRLTAAGAQDHRQVSKFFGWNIQQAVRDPAEFSLEMLSVEGWTQSRLLELAEGYEHVSRITPENPSAWPRAVQLRQIAGLYESGAAS
mgnify:CR=1 FL=1